MSGHSRGGDDVLTGNAPVNFLYGDAEYLSEFARGGDDRLISGEGVDHMYGDGAIIDLTARTGRDVFEFAADSGHDFIYDFEVQKDAIEYAGEHAPSIELADVNGDGTTDSVVDFDDQNYVTEYGSSLTQSDLLLAV